MNSFERRLQRAKDSVFRRFRTFSTGHNPILMRKSVFDESEKPNFESKSTIRHSAAFHNFLRLLFAGYLRAWSCSTFQSHLPFPIAETWALLIFHYVELPHYCLVSPDLFRPFKGYDNSRLLWVMITMIRLFLEIVSSEVVT